MPPRDADQTVLPSVLDRLLDPNPELERDPPRGRGQALTELRSSVGRDLENLLNTRQRCLSFPPQLTELDQSMVNYGIPDFSGANFATTQGRHEFQGAIERTIRRYEPRFKTVKVSLLENREPEDRTIRFRIEALMYAEPAPEQMIYDSVIDPVTRDFSVVSS
ncbi:MAG: type VI secretion system baseplate subunit TssE [Alphaproteobacteria bacterium]|jgi:type VI secretion system protein ImpF|nr:type VI secretion system baseplate subunit TssE [Alphaproteobacteria bacterium]